MELKIHCKERLLNATVINTPSQSKAWVLFISGGNTTQGKTRYHDWQLKLSDLDIHSISFDYSGVNGSGDTLKFSSLQERIDEVLAVINWIKNHTDSKQKITLFAPSMGGYIGLGAVNSAARLVDKILLYAPAAYSSNAHDLKFDGSFTSEIRKKNSWKTSLSFDWFKNNHRPTLMFTPDKDEVIPPDITELYVTLGRKNLLFSHLTLQNCSHNCWVDNKENKKHRDNIFQHLIQLLSYKP